MAHGATKALVVREAFVALPGEPNKLSLLVVLIHYFLSTEYGKDTR